MRLRYFAWLRERIGAGSEELEPPEAVVTVAQLAAFLAARSAGHAAAFADLKRIRAAIDQREASLEDHITGAAEIAFFPPMTGG